MIRGMSKCTQLGNGFTDHVFGRKLSVFFHLFYHTSGHVWDHCEYINISSVCYYTRPDIRETRGKRTKRQIRESDKTIVRSLSCIIYKH